MRQEAHLVALHGASEHTISELDELFPPPVPGLPGTRLGLAYDDNLTRRTASAYLAARVSFS